MKLTALGITFFICQFIFSQKNDNPNVFDTGFITIKEAEIKNFPATNFLEAINGLFPWVFSQTPNTNDFTFIIDGFIMQDINGISLYDIEEIQFSKSGFQGTSFPLARFGTFFIKTKKAIKEKGLFILNSQSNISFNGTTVSSNNGLYGIYRNPIGSTIHNQLGNLFTNHISYSIKKKKINLHTSAQLQSSASPKLIQNLSYAGLNYYPYIDTVNFTRKALQNNFKYFLSIGYEINEYLKANLKVNYYNSKDVIDTLSIDSTIGFTGGAGKKRSQTTAINSNYLNLAASLNWNPFKSLVNKTSIEYFIENIDYDNRFINYNTINTSNPNLTTSHLITKNSIFKYSNDLNYQVTQTKVFQLNTSINLSFYHFNNDYSDTVHYSNGFSKSKNYYDSKITTLNPRIDFKVSKFLSGYFGYPFFLSDIKTLLDQNSIVNPFYGVNVNLRQLLNLVQNFNTLNLNFQFSDMPIGQLPDYHLGSILGTEQFRLKPIYSSSYNSSSYKQFVLKNKSFSIQLISKFNSGNTIGIEYNSQLLNRFFLVAAPLSASTPFFNVRGEQFVNGVSLFAQFRLINKQSYKWKIRANILLPKVEFKPPFNSSTLQQPINYSLQSGIQNNIQIKHFTIQANINIGLDKNYYEMQFISGSSKLVEEKINEIGLSYFALSYDFSNSKNKLLKNLDLSIQSRNIITNKDLSQYYQLNKYMGLNLSYKF